MNYSVYLSADDQPRLIIYDGDDPILRYIVQDWLDENVGYTTNTIWHRDRWHPMKPKWIFKAVRTTYDSTNPYGLECCFKFIEAEDAMGFKLRWL